MDHEDFAGNRGTLSAGDLQFMTAGKGMNHLLVLNSRIVLTSPRHCAR
jgi:hypothetical protein